MGVIEGRVKAAGAIRRPGPAVVSPGNLVIKIEAGVEVPKSPRECFVPRVVDRVSKARLVEADHQQPDVTEVPVVDEVVLIEDHPGVVLGGQMPTQELWILLALLGSPSVPPLAAPGRGR